MVDSFLCSLTSQQEEMTSGGDCGQGTCPPAHYGRGFTDQISFLCRRICGKVPPINIKSHSRQNVNASVDADFRFWEQAGETRDTHGEPHLLVSLASLLPIGEKIIREKR